MGGIEFLLEIGTEEIPARFLEPALQGLKEEAVKEFKENRLEYNDIQTYGTPRRLVLFAGGMAESQASLEQEVKGPAKRAAFDPEGQPTKAALGFSRSQGVGINDLIVRPVKGVEYVFALRREAGRMTIDLLSEMCPRLIAKINFPRPMRWGDLDVKFARPIRWLYSSFGNNTVKFDYANLSSGKRTYGHRFLGGGSYEVGNPAGYFVCMDLNYVMVDPVKRKETIDRQIKALAARENGVVKDDPRLLDEVTNLVEYPTAFTGSFDEKYLELPPEVLVTSMGEHQRYFPVFDREDRLLPRFIAVANSVPERIDKIRSGNERVLQARLADAQFFYREDLKEPLVSKTDQLKKVVFLEGLGTIYEKTERLVALAPFLADSLGESQGKIKNVQRASSLCKSDLVTNMVYEFPELQGVMGREYALRSGENPTVSEAIYEHYLPRFAGDDLPTTQEGRIVSISDKIDNIVGCFSAGIKPTGSQDPYALRRQALGVCLIILDAGMHISLNSLIDRSYRLYGDRIKTPFEEIAVEIDQFFKQRLKGIFSERGFSYDLIEAVLETDIDDLTSAMERLQALADFKEDPAFASLLTVFHRAHNLSKKAVAGAVEPSLFVDPVEDVLYREYLDIRGVFKDALAEGDYQAALVQFTRFRKPLDGFFEGVMVMDEDINIRTNRLSLLKNISELICKIADISKIVD